MNNQHYRQLSDLTADCRRKGLIMMWTVYSRPSDYPDGYVARLFVVGKGVKGNGGTPWVIRGATLESVRKAIPSEASERIPRDPQDEPQIVETWL
jgi:hypothetical protein